MPQICTSSDSIASSVWLKTWLSVDLLVVGSTLFKAVLDGSYCVSAGRE